MEATPGETASAMQRSEDGRAIDPSAFRSAVLNNPKRRSLAEADPEIMRALMSENEEDLQQFLIEERQSQQGERSNLLPEAMRAKSRVPRFD